MGKTTGLAKYRRVCRNGSSNRGKASKAYLRGFRPFRFSTPYFSSDSSSYPPFLSDRLVNALMKKYSDSDSHSHLTKCSSSSTIGGEKEITNNTSSDSEPHSHLTKCSTSSTIGGEKGTSSDSTVKSVVKDRKKGKKRKKSGGDGSEERKGKKTKKKSLLVTE